MEQTRQAFDFAINRIVRRTVYQTKGVNVGAPNNTAPNSTGRRRNDVSTSKVTIRTSSSEPDYLLPNSYWTFAVLTELLLCMDIAESVTV